MGLPCAKTTDAFTLDRIHFNTKDTGAGDEIGWDFADHVMRSKISFGAYCDIMDDRYRRRNSNSASFIASFMANKPFIAWWFSWITKCKIDFRKPCNLYMYQPKYLAADDTKIGINTKSATVLPTETPTVDSLRDIPKHTVNSFSANYDEPTRSEDTCNKGYAIGRKVVAFLFCGLITLEWSLLWLSHDTRI